MGRKIREKERTVLNSYSRCPSWWHPGILTSWAATRRDRLLHTLASRGRATQPINQPTDRSTGQPIYPSLSIHPSRLGRSVKSQVKSKSVKPVYPVLHYIESATNRSTNQTKPAIARTLYPQHHDLPPPTYSRYLNYYFDTTDRHRQALWEVDGPPWRNCKTSRHEYGAYTHLCVDQPSAR